MGQSQWSGGFLCRRNQRMQAKNLMDYWVRIYEYWVGSESSEVFQPNGERTGAGRELASASVEAV